MGSPPDPVCTEALPDIDDVTPEYGWPSGWVEIKVLSNRERRRP
jgi:hypothetical protein